MAIQIFYLAIITDFCIPSRMSCVNVSIVVLCLTGVALSYYAIHIKNARDADSSFQATCDLDGTISCTSAITSE